MLRLPTPFERCCQRPTKVDVDLVPEDNRAFLEDIAKRLLVEVESDDERKCIEFLRYVAASLSLRSHAGPATAIVKDGHAICDGMARVFNALCRVSGIPCRDVGMYGLRGMGSHAASEAYYNDSWHYFDPTFGIFFQSPQGDILAAHQLVLDPRAGKMMCTVKSPWQGYEGGKAGLPFVAPQDFLEKKYQYRLPERYREWFGCAYPITYRQAATSFPVKIDLQGEDAFSCHTAAYADDSPSCRIGIDPSTGWTSVGFAFSHTLMLKTAPGCMLEVEYGFTATPPDLQLMPLAGLRVLDRQVRKKSVSFTVDTTDTECVALMTAPTFGRVTMIRASRIPHSGTG